MSADVVLFFQEGPAARRHRALGPTVAQQLAGAEVQLPEVSKLVVLALKYSRLTKDAAAKQMLITPSLFGRQLLNVDGQHTSLQRLWLLPDDFWREFMVHVIEARRLGRVQRPTLFDLGAMG